jgi:hypothetical protein
VERGGRRAASVDIAVWAGDSVEQVVSGHRGERGRGARAAGDLQPPQRRRLTERVSSEIRKSY